MNFFINILLFIPLLCSCQQYNSPAYDEKEKVLRNFPVENSTRMVMDSLWNKRDSLTYLRLKNLEIVAMSEVSYIPNWIGDFDKMEIFQVFNEKNKIKTIPQSFGKLSSLVQINIPNNHVSSLPNSFYDLKKLKYLDFENNPIKLLDKKIENFQNLKILILEKTDIKTLPIEFCKLNKLESLNLNFSKIIDLPKCLGILQNLVRVDVSNTQLKEFPVEILNAPKLETIHARGLKLKNYKEVKAICEKRNITFYYDE